MQAYFDCFSGISGDMTLGAMVHLGVPVEWLRHELAHMPLDGFDIKAQPVMRQGISAMQVEVIVAESHHHRHHRHIQALIKESPFSKRVKENSLAIFGRIATAEAAIHNVPEAEVHFHEVGSMDAIVDIVGTCLAMEYLNIDAIAVSPLPLGSGFVQCQHGTLPVPAPATMEILKGVPVHAGNVAQEMVTPTGAAIAAAMAGEFGPLPEMHIDKVGYGAGTRELETQPNLLRVMLGQFRKPAVGGTTQKLVMVESCIDDMNPELFGYLMEKLFDQGALDVFWVPVYMKKNRPGTMVQVLCDAQKRDGIIECIFLESTTLGVRCHDVHRWALAREAVTVDTELGEVAAKKVTGIDGAEHVMPEFEACRQLAQSKSLPLRSVYEMVCQASRAPD